jgi:hypothetical protein
MLFMSEFAWLPPIKCLGLFSGESKGKGAVKQAVDFVGLCLGSNYIWVHQ